MLESYLVTPVQVVKTKRDEHGDVVYDNTKMPQIVYMRILDHAEIMLNDRKEQIQTDSMAWASATAGITENDILKQGNDWYRVTRLNNVKRGGEDTVLFQKMWLSSAHPIAGIS